MVDLRIPALMEIPWETTQNNNIMSRPQLPCCESEQDLFEQHRLFKAKILQECVTNL